MRAGNERDYPIHHKRTVYPITDNHPALRDNEIRLGQRRIVPTPQRRPQKPPNSHFGALFDNQRRKIAPKSFVLKDFISKSFRIKDRI